MIGVGLGRGRPRSLKWNRRRRGRLHEKRRREIARALSEVSGAIEAALDRDPLLGPQITGLGLLDLPVLVAVAEGEVFTKHAGLGFGEEDIEVSALREVSVCIAGLCGRHGEAALPEGDEDLVQEEIGFPQRRDTGDAQFLISRS